MRKLFLLLRRTKPPTEGMHSTYHDFLVLDLGHGFGALSRKELATKAKVTGFTTRSLQHLRQTQVTNNLKETNKDKGVAHDTVCYHGIVRRGGRQARSEGMEDDTLVDANVTGNGAHGDTSVLEFRLAKVVHGEIVRNSQGIKADIIANVALAVLRVGEEGHGGALFGREDRKGLA